MLKQLSRGLAIGVATVAAAMFAGTQAVAADYPSKPIQLIIPYDAGGAADLQARILASVAPQYIGHAVLASNRTGAGGVTGSNYVVRSKPDGYTLLLARVGSQAGVPAINPGIPYQWNDYTFLGLLEKNPFVLAVNSKSDLTSLADIEAKLKAGEKLSYSTGGVGTLPHIAMVMVLDGMGMPSNAITHVPYKGGGAAAAALVGGHVDMFFQNLSGVIGQIQAGTLRALFVTTPERVGAIKDVPTVTEVGRPRSRARHRLERALRAARAAAGRRRQVGGRARQGRRGQVLDQDDHEARLHSGHQLAGGDGVVRGEPVQGHAGGRRSDRHDDQVVS